jgi:phosphatidylserine decarboxylase
MRKPSIGIAPEGAPFIALLAFSALIFALIRCWPMAVILLAATWFAGHFFRDPERVTPQEKDIAVSPADGRIVKIQPARDPFSGDDRTCISVFMNVFSVHVNRSPVAGTVKSIAYSPGKFFNAALDKASTDNERCAYDIAGKEGSFTVVQIAGLIARRIVCRAEEGDTVARGERFGLIRFGSRVDIYLPAGFEPAVQIGRRVIAGQSVLARASGAAEAQPAKR